MALLPARLLLLTTLLALLSGCAGEDAAPVADEAAATEPARSTADERAYGPLQTLFDDGRSFLMPHPESLPAPQATPEVLAFEVEVGDLQLAADARHVNVTFTRGQLGVSAFADNCRVYRGAELLDLAAFSDAQVGSVNTTGTCTITFDALRAGDIRFVVQVDPTPRQHDVHVLVQGALAQ